MMRGAGVLRSRLFYKVFLALCCSMLLSILGAFAYIRLTGGVIPSPPPGELTLGRVPMVPMVSGVLAFLVVGGGLAWYILRPLRQLQWALGEIARGNMEVRLKPLLGRRSDEIAEVAGDFDRMVVQLRQLTESRQRLLHDVSHELRSPLSRMQAAIGLMRQDGASVPRMIDRIQKDSERLDVLIEELLTLHRLEAAAGTDARQRVDLMDLLQAIVEDASLEAQATGRGVGLHAEGPFVAEVDGELLYRAFENIIRNAVKFTAVGTQVDVQAELSPGPQEFVLRVRDHGSGVPQASLEAIFEPFVRLENAEPFRGAGLGLSLVRRVVVLHGGSIAASLPVDGGLLVTVRLPLR